MARVVFLPHVGLGGGAGIYIKDMILGLSEANEVYVAGKYKSVYPSMKLSFIGESLFSLLVLPCYSGVSSKYFYFYLALSLLLAPLCLVLLILNRNQFKHIDVLVLTSSIQMLIPFLFKLIRIRTDTCMLIQEDLRFESLFFSRVVFKFLKLNEHIVSITHDWAKYAEKFGLEPLVLVNKINLVGDESTFGLKLENNYDLIYVGGNQSIKGFDLICDFLEKYIVQSQLKIAIVGCLSTSSLMRIEKIKSKSTSSKMRIDILGHIDDLVPYYACSKVLILPIVAPHFCRPAVEMGAQGKSFVISRLKGLGEFAIDGSNCKMFEPCNVDSLMDAISCLLTDDGLRRLLEEQNNKIFRDHFSPATYQISLEAIHKGFIGE